MHTTTKHTKPHGLEDLGGREWESIASEMQAKPPIRISPVLAQSSRVSMAKWWCFICELPLIYILIYNA
jgi:hypothetical protein